MAQAAVFLCLMTCLGPVAALAQAPPAPGAHAMITSDALKWGPAPPGLPKGSEVAVLAGDPAAPGGEYTLRVRMPAGYAVPPHWHPGDEHVTVLEGSLMVGMGDTVTETGMKTLTAGSFAVMPKQMRHYVRARSATILQIHGTGPFAITYVKPSDDPRAAPSN